MRIVFILAMVLGLYSCQSEKKKQGLGEKQREIEIGLLDSTHVYTAKEIGWTMNVLPDWEVQTKEDINKNNQKGKEALEKTIGTEIDGSNHAQLINLKKGHLNTLLSSIDLFSEQIHGSYEKTTKVMINIVKQTFSDKGIKADYAEDSALIDGLRFSVFKINIYNDEKTEVILRQVLYTRLLNGYGFSVNINCRDEKLMTELEMMLFSSKFSKRD